MSSREYDRSLQLSSMLSLPLPEYAQNYLYLNRDYLGNRLFSLLSVASLPISGLSPAIDLIIVVNSDWVIRSTCDWYDRYLFELACVLAGIILEEVWNELGDTSWLYCLEQTQLSLKAPAPTKHISDVRQSQSMVHATGNRDDTLIAEFANRPGCSWKHSAS